MWSAKERGIPVSATVERVVWPETLNTSVWEIDLDGVKGVVPLGETGLADAGLMPRFVGQKILVKIKGMDKENRVAACSRREVIADAQERLFKTLKQGMIIDAVVKAILPADPVNGRPPRLVVDIGGGVLVDVPRKWATRSHAARLNDLYRPGQAVKVKVLQVDSQQSGIIRVSVADVEADPWSTAAYKRGEIVAGQVVAVRDVVFVEVKPGLAGIAPLPLRGRLRRGDKVVCQVTAFDPKSKKLHLRLRGGRLA